MNNTTIRFHHTVQPVGRGHPISTIAAQRSAEEGIAVHQLTLREVPNWRVPGLCLGRVRQLIANE